VRPCDCSEVDKIFLFSIMKLSRGKSKDVIGLKVNNREKGFQGKWFTFISTNDIVTNRRNDVVYSTGV
jgi:hypothetical protein